MGQLMKGHVWSKQKHKMTYPCWVEPKIDDIRCHIIVTPNGVNLNDWAVEFKAYSGKPLANMQQFATAWRAISANTGVTEFDCGFEVNQNFNDSYRWVRSTKALPEDLKNADCVFHLFDVPRVYTLSGNDAPFSKRCETRHNIMCLAGLNFEGVIVLVPAGFPAHNEAQVEAIYQRFRNAGFEGAMVKSYEHLYEYGKRSYGWLKMKPSEDADGVIVGFEEAICGVDQPELGLRKGHTLQRIGAVLLHCEDGSQVAPHGIPHELGRDMYEHPEKYMGQTVEFKFMERDRQGGYRHPTFHRIREPQT